MEDLLDTWGLSHLIDNFKEQGIDVSTLVELSTDHIKELIPKLGDRIKFEKCLINYKNGITLNDDFTNNEIIIFETPANLGAYNIQVPDAKPGSDTDTTVTINSLTSSSSSNDSLVETVSNTVIPDNTKHNELRKKLESELEGIEIIASATKNCLSRKKLVNFVINQEFRGNEEFRITTTRFQELAKQIVEIFPNENIETYFIPFHQEHGKNCLAKGKLWDKYHNKRRALKVLGLMPPKYQASSSTTLEINPEEHETNDELEEKISWLHHNVAPWTTVEKCWLETTFARKNFQDLNSVEEILQSYPALKQPLGYSLIDADFSNLYKLSSEKFFTLWPDVSKKIIQLIKNRNGLANNIYKKINITSDSISALLVLPYHLNHTRLKGIKWRPSKAETASGFCVNLKTEGELLPFLQERKEKYQRLKLTAQPLVIIIGDTDAVESSFVSVNEILYKFETPLKAVDLCFKSFHVLNAKYPIESEHIWTFIQKFVYNISTPFDNTYTAINALISDLNNIES